MFKKKTLLDSFQVSKCFHNMLSVLNINIYEKNQNQLNLPLSNMIKESIHYACNVLFTPLCFEYLEWVLLVNYDFQVTNVSFLVSLSMLNKIIGANILVTCP